MISYHEFVFDEANRRFVGRFEDMYQAEDKYGFDSWHQEDTWDVSYQIAFGLVKSCWGPKVLDIGCGKGFFCSDLGDEMISRITAIDISETAILKAKSRNPEINFIKMDARDILSLPDTYDLAIAMEILSYLPEWRSVIANMSKKARAGMISLYLPPNPIGFIKSFDELMLEFAKWFHIEDEVMLNGNKIFLLGKSNKMQ